MAQPGRPAHQVGRMAISSTARPGIDARARLQVIVLIARASTNTHDERLPVAVNAFVLFLLPPLGSVSSLSFVIQFSLAGVCHPSFHVHSCPFHILPPLDLLLPLSWL